jgi:hypothetical protein
MQHVRVGKAIKWNSCTSRIKNQTLMMFNVSESTSAYIFSLVLVFKITNKLLCNNFNHFVGCCYGTGIMLSYFMIIIHTLGGI